MCDLDEEVLGLDPGLKFLDLDLKFWKGRGPGGWRGPGPARFTRPARPGGLRDTSIFVLTLSTAKAGRFQSRLQATWRTFVGRPIFPLEDLRPPTKWTGKESWVALRTSLLVYDLLDEFSIICGL